MNRIILTGRLAKNPELRYLPKGDPVATFILAVNRKYSKNEADFINIVAYGKQAEPICTYLAKGRRAGVDGRLQIRVVEKDGQKRYFTEVVADEVEFLDSKQDDSKQEEYSDNKPLPEVDDEEENDCPF